MRHYLYIFATILLITLTGCVDEVVVDPSDPTVNPGGGDAPTLTFTVSAAPFGDDHKSRAISYSDPTYYEDWIDTQDKFRVLFFISPRGFSNADQLGYSYGPDYFLFESKARWVTQLPADEKGRRVYQVTVPLYDLGSLDKEYSKDWGRIRSLLRDYPFKVAILANHPIDNGVYNAPDWSIKDSYLSVNQSAKTVNDLHHCSYENTYSEPKRYVAYDFMLKSGVEGINGYASGPWIDWVDMRSKIYDDTDNDHFNSYETAAGWLRRRWNPALKYNEDQYEYDYQPQYRKYHNLWYVWNFGGTSNTGVPYSLDRDMAENPHINEWETRNGSLLRSWIDRSVNGTTTGWYPTGYMLPLNDLSAFAGNKLSYLGFTPATSTSSALAYGVRTSSNGRTYYGVSLPETSTSTTVTDETPNVFNFPMTGHGTIYVTYAKYDPYLTSSYGVPTSGTVNVRCAIKKSDGTYGTNSPKDTDKALSKDQAIGSGPHGTIYRKGFHYKIEDVEQTAFLYATGGNVVIYQIEYVLDEYLYLTDREGKIPSAESPIPMYGIQEFEPLSGDLWAEGSSFDLSTGTDYYKGKSISLLRAVAKVEVLIPKSLGVPKHVYLRSGNRFVRCEPIDVQTPTDKLWKDHDTECEWKLIQDQGPFYDLGSTELYKQKLVWYWGSWKDWDWKYQGASNNYLKYVSSYSSKKVPHLFNVFIQRSDFVAFIDVTDFYNDHFYHYIYYMGENTIDAPTDHFYEKSGVRPMVPRVEIRFDQKYQNVSKLKTNSDTNLEDNDCYRFYFTEKGIASGARDANGVTRIASDKYESDYEKNNTYTKEHWPIIRNHYYRFVIDDRNYNGMGGLVVDASIREPELEFN